MALLIRNARVLTMGDGARPRRGKALAALGVVARADVLVDGDRIAEVRAHDASAADPASLQRPGASSVREIDAAGRVLMPAFVDCHMHACWAGERLDEWDLKRAGKSYLQILAAGGGIMSTVRAVRAASEEELRDTLSARLEVMLREGTTTVEVKSGYGLTTADELKMLRAIAGAAAAWPGTVVPTALLGHAIDAERPDFVERVINETLPAVSAEFRGIAVDAYCEKGAWSLADTLRLMDRAMESGHPVRVHADQFNDLGLIPEAIRRGFRSVDHLEASTPEHLRTLAGSGVYGVVLPCAGFHTDGRYAAGRAFVDGGGALAVATNCNPGSAPTSSVPMAVALAVRFCGLSPAEAIGACTANAASLLGFEDRGVIAPGRRADLVLLRHRDERELAHEFGGNPVEVVLCGGRVVAGP